VSLSRDSASIAHASNALRESLDARRQSLKACQAEAEARLEMERGYIESTTAALAELLGQEAGQVSAASQSAAQLHEAQVQLKQALAAEQRLMERLGPAGRLAGAKELFNSDVSTDELESRAEAASRQAL
jgi:hypothetical protein